MLSVVLDASSFGGQRFFGEEQRFVNQSAEDVSVTYATGKALVVPAGGVAWFCWTGSEWGSDSGQASGPYAVDNFTDYDAEHGFPKAPVDKFTVIYIRSGGHASDTRPKADEQGDDFGGDGTMARPLYSPWGVFSKFARRAEEGEHFLVKMAGGLTEEEKAAGVNPWYGQCSSMRQYPSRGLELFGGEAYVNNFCFEGPLKGALVPVTGLVVTNVQPIGEGTIASNGRSRWRYNSNAGALPQIGSFARVRRSGRLVSFEMQVTGSVEDTPSGPNGYIYTDCGNFSNGGVFDVQNTDVVDFITHAAEFIPTSRPGGVDSGVGGADGISLCGWGSANMHGRLTNGTNPRYNFAMVGFENLNIRAFFGGGFDRCFIYHQFNVFDSSFSMRGCVVNCQLPTKYVNSQINVHGEVSSINEQVGHFPEVSENYDEYNGDLSAADALLLKPLNLTTGGVSVLHTYVNEAVAGGAVIQGGRFEPRHGATFVGGLILQGGAQFVMEAPVYPVCIRGVHDSGDAAAIWVKGNSVATLELRHVTMDDVDNHFRVGPYDSDPIQLGTEVDPDAGTLRDPAAWNGNFCRYDVVGGYPQGDFSAIRDTTKFPP